MLGAILTVELGYEAEIRANLDQREAGYDLVPISLWHLDGRQAEPAQTYVVPPGRAGAHAWIGQRSVDEVAKLILDGAYPLKGVSYAMVAALRFTQLGSSSGIRDEYLDRLADALVAQAYFVDEGEARSRGAGWTGAHHARGLSPAAPALR